VNWVNALEQILKLTSAFDLRMALFIFIVCIFGESVVGIPYVMESIWLLTGYQLGARVLSPFHLIWFWLVAQFGRQAGAIILYQVGKYGSIPVVRFYQRKHLSRFFPKSVANSRVLNRINLVSPFSVAFGRLLAMRIPITLTLGAMRKPKTLAIGVLLSSIIWDAVYISAGIIVGTTAVIKPIHMFVASLIGITIIYLITFLVRHAINRFKSGRNSILGPPVLAKDNRNT
jgi:membrane protein DedA with SNARE-associated domain